MNLWKKQMNCLNKVNIKLGMKSKNKTTLTIIITENKEITTKISRILDKIIDNFNSNSSSNRRNKLRLCLDMINLGRGLMRRRRMGMVLMMLVWIRVIVFLEVLGVVLFLLWILCKWRKDRRSNRKGLISFIWFNRKN